MVCWHRWAGTTVNVDLHKIYFINMDKDSERRAVMEQRIERCFPGIPCQRMRGMEPREISQHDGFCRDRLTGKAAPVNGRYPFPGIIACTLTHRMVYQAILQDFQTGQGNCLVLEDDCVFDETVREYLSGLSDRDIPPDWRVLKHSLGWKSPLDRINRHFYDLRRARGRRWSWYWATHFMIFRSDRIADVLAEMEKGQLFVIDRWIRDRVDGAYSFARPLHIKQSNMGGSNTNPDFSDGSFEDRNEDFGVASSLRRVKQYVRAALKGD